MDVCCYATRCKRECVLLLRLMGLGRASTPTDSTCTVIACLGWLCRLLRRAFEWCVFGVAVQTAAPCF